MIRVQDRIEHSFGMRYWPTVYKEVDALDEFDKLAIYMDYFIHYRFKGYAVDTFDDFKKVKYLDVCIYMWYYWHFQII